MKKLLLSIFLFFLSIPAFSASCFVQANPAYTGSTADSACRSYYDSVESANMSYGGVLKLSETNYECRFINSGSYYSLGGVVCDGVCSGGSTWNSTVGACECPVGQVLNSEGQCAPKCNAGDLPADFGLNTDGFISYEGKSPTFCVNGCVVKGQEPISVNVNGAGWTTHVDGPFQETGEECTSEPAVTEPPKDYPEKCSVDQVQIGTTKDGKPLCAPKSAQQDGQSTTTENTVTNPDGSTVTTKTTKTKNKDGSETTTTTTTTKSADGTSVTGSTTRSVGTTPGGQQGTDTSSEESDDLCEQHPELNICKNAQVTGGNCSGGVDDTACEGDAIQCSILRQQRKEYCETLAMKDSEPYKLGDKVLNGQDPQAGTYPTLDNAQSINATSLDTSGGGGSCFTDKSFTVQGRTVTIPFSQVCDYLLALRAVSMVIAALACLKILGGAIFNG